MNAYISWLFGYGKYPVNPDNPKKCDCTAEQKADFIIAQVRKGATSEEIKRGLIALGWD